jgi:hypothetical protein
VLQRGAYDLDFFAPLAAHGLQTSCRSLVEQSSRLNPEEEPLSINECITPHWTQAPPSLLQTAIFTSGGMAPAAPSLIWEIG